MSICVLDTKKDIVFRRCLLLRVPSGTRTHDIQNHKQVVKFIGIPVFIGISDCKDTKNVVNAYNFPKLFVSLQPIYTEIKPNKMAEESNNEFHNVVPLQIRFNDVDKFGHVNNTIYFQFYDSGKTDYVSTVCKGFDWDCYAIFVVKIEVEFFAQIKGPDRIAVRTRTAKLGNKSFHLEQEIFDTDTQEVKSRCLSILVLYDLEQKLSMPFPDEWRKAISDYDGL